MADLLEQTRAALHDELALFDAVAGGAEDGDLAGAVLPLIRQDQERAVLVAALRLYAAACLVESCQLVRAGRPWPEAVHAIDRGLIRAGVALRARMRQLADQMLAALAPAAPPQRAQVLLASADAGAPPARPVPVLRDPDAVSLTEYLAAPPAGADARGLAPVHLTAVAAHWPALARWNSVAYLLGQTHAGERLVPVEIGRSYVAAQWSQDLVPMRVLLDRIAAGETVYLAQHNLFHQVPALHADVLMPDCVYTDLPGKPDETAVVSNCWLGAAGTVSPLHYDEHDNVLVQVVGCKLVRLYAPGPAGLYGDGTAVAGNTCGVDVDAGSGSTAAAAAYRARHAGFRWHDGYVECVLRPGDGLFIPAGWWHYVRALTASFSVNYWF
ncbi:uncharacterized protein V1510DRAFT_432461 [Dipodascopsis tothii]|uniref:uncharacterized protein n=1 Tax=Dipodascopsis tothii TaxID=44089 RepID=UPI0034CF998E